jgi:hypothetical protein
MNELYNDNYKIMVISHIINKDNYDYEDLYLESIKIFKKWKLWDLKHNPNCSWIDSVNEYLNNN